MSIYQDLVEKFNFNQKYNSVKRFVEAYEIAKQYDIPVIVTTDSHYLTMEDQAIHRAYLNSKQGDREVDDFYSSTFLMNADEICDYLNDNGFEQSQIEEVGLDHRFGRQFMTDPGQVCRACQYC